MQFFMMFHRLTLWWGLGGMVVLRTASDGLGLSKKLSTAPTGNWGRGGEEHNG